MVYKGHKYRELSARQLAFEIIGHLEVAGQGNRLDPCITL